MRMDILDSIKHLYLERYAYVTVAVTCALALLCAGCGAPADLESGELVAGTSLIADIVTDLTEQQVAAFTLLPSASCPSQFDMKASDIRRLQQARVVLIHPWQLQLGNIRSAIDAARLPTDRVIVVEVMENWMLPEAQETATAALAEILCTMYAGQAEAIRARAALRTKAIHAVATQARETLPRDATAPHTVLCNEMQEPFVRWAGFEIAATYARPEDWSVAETERLVRVGQERQVALVIDNLQSGGMAMSATLARDIGATNVVLSNFPNGFRDTPTWEAAFMENITRLQEALAQLESHDY